MNGQAIYQTLAVNFLAAYTAVNTTAEPFDYLFLFLAAYTAVNIAPRPTWSSSTFLAAYTAVNIQDAERKRKLLFLSCLHGSERRRGP